MRSRDPVKTDIVGVARKAAKDSAKLSKRLRRSPTVTLMAVGAGERATITVPRAAFGLLVEILDQMADGNDVAVIPHARELTTQEAAAILNVSRPYVIGLLEQGRIPFHKTGTHRRIRLADLLAYKKHQDEVSRRALAELTAEAQELGLGY